MQKKFETVRYWLLLSLVFAAPMSFSPSFALPVFDFPSFRIGLYQVLAVLFVVACLPLVKKHWASLAKNIWFLAGGLLVLLSLGIGLATTEAPARTALYGASLVALLALGTAGYLAWKGLSKRQIDRVITSLLWSGVTFGSLALVQLVVASFDKTALGTLCTGCSDAVFGFPRINLFAAEPQFFANSLLPALFASFFFRKNARLANRSLFLTSIAIGLTFSRGAFFAVAVSAGLYVILLSIYKKPVAAFVKYCCFGLLGVLVAFGLLVTSATIRYNETPYIAFNTTVSMLDHLSMGKLHIPQKTEVAPPTTNNPTDDFQPEGYVAASSNDRLSAASLAINAWNDSPKTLLFGVGMGNLGAYVNTYIAPVPSNLTVYIWYVLVLAELGLLGLLGLLLAPVRLVSRLMRADLTLPLVALALTVTVAFLVQLFSFGTYINIMYQYLFIGLFLAATAQMSALRTP